MKTFIRKKVGHTTKFRLKYNKWATSRQNQQNDMRAQQRLKSAWTSAQSIESSLCA